MNASVDYIKASDGSGNASLMTITQVRTAPATTITVNTVTGAPTKFFATMGTPHTFNDPVTGETITVISEASAVDFAGHIDSGKVEIDAIADGQTDLGSKVGDIIVIRPNTPWADNLHGVLSTSLNDNGTLKNNAVTTAAIADAAVTSSKVDWATSGKIWWEEIGRVVLNSIGNTITVSSLPSRKYLYILVNLKNSGALNVGLRFNGDTASNYNFRASTNGSTDASGASTTFIPLEQGSYCIYGALEVLNDAAFEKGVLARISGANIVGAANVPSRVELSGKWSNTSSSINSVTVYNAGAGTFAVGSEVIVLGHD